MTSSRNFRLKLAGTGVIIKGAETEDRDTCNLSLCITLRERANRRNAHWRLTDLDNAVIIDGDVDSAVRLVAVFQVGGGRNRQLWMTDSRLVNQTPTFTRTVTLGRLVVSHVGCPSLHTTLIELLWTADGRVACCIDAERVDKHRSIIQRYFTIINGSLKYNN